MKNLEARLALEVDFDIEFYGERIYVEFVGQDAMPAGVTGRSLVRTTSDGLRSECRIELLKASGYSSHLEDKGKNRLQLFCFFHELAHIVLRLRGLECSLEKSLEETIVCAMEDVFCYMYKENNNTRVAKDRKEDKAPTSGGAVPMTASNGEYLA